MALLAALGFARGGGRPRRRERIVPEGEPSRRAETVVICLLLGAAACALMFVVVYALDWPHQTQYLGICLGAALALIAAALIVTGEKLIVTEELEEDYPPLGDPEEEAKVEQIVAESGSRLTRKRLLGGAAGLAGGALGAALDRPRRLARPGARHRVPLQLALEARPPPGRRGRQAAARRATSRRKPSTPPTPSTPTARSWRRRWSWSGSTRRRSNCRPSAPTGRREGILAYSKICTHAACAIALYRTPRFEEAEPEPALVCPCHYSTFNPARGGTVEFGPAGRDLPQLPLTIDPAGDLRAAGNFSEPVGPSFWGVRTRRPSA